MELELEVSESEEFPACESVEVTLCQRCQRKATATTVYISVKKEDKATQTVSRKVWRKQRKVQIRNLKQQS